MKQKEIRSKTVLLLPSIFLLLSCVGNQISSISDSNTSEETTTEASDQNKGTKEVGVLKSYLKNLNLKGYVGTNLKNNVRYWQTTAYKNNPNIITQIDEASHFNGDITLNRLLGTDYYSVDEYFDIDVYKKNSVNYLGWNMKSLPSAFKDRDIRYESDPNSITDWSGAKELWIEIDASEIDSAASVRIAFEDDAIGVESYSLIDGTTVKLYSSGSTKEVIVSSNGFVSFPQGYKGYLALPLDSEHFSRYYNNNGNSRIDLNKVVQFQIAVKSDSRMIGKTLYMKDFAIVGNVSGNKLPVEISNTTATYKIIWDISKVKRKTQNSYSSSLPWYGEFVGKLLTGISYSYRAYPDSDLKDSANEIVDKLSSAQGEDGYLGVYTGDSRYSLKTSNWDLWNQYHCIVGLLEWYKTTGNSKAFTIAKKCLDKIYDVFHNRSYLVVGGFETNRAIAHGYALMYQVTQDSKYLDEAVRIIETDCQDSNGWYKCALKKKEFSTSSSARWEVLHMMMTLGILYEETQHQEYYDVMSEIWNDLSTNEIHNTGGFTTNEAATGDPYKEGVIETCCTIAWMAFSNEYYRYSRDVNVVDELERSYFNALLGSLEDDDKYCSYNTPVNGIAGTAGTYDGRRVPSQKDISFQYNQGSKDMNCCQANLARGIGQISQWALLTDGPALYVNYYGNCSGETIVNNKNVILTQTTVYPLNGKINLKISELENSLQFKLKLRIPSWCKKAKVNYDDKTIDATAGTYFDIDKTWGNGDEVNLDFEMQFTAWKGEKSQDRYTSVYYGPFLLALDEETLNQSESLLQFDQNLSLSCDDFKQATIRKGTEYGAWIYVDVPVGDTFVRLVDFASAGKYNGKTNPSSYYSWLNISGASVSSQIGIERWKTPLY